MQEISEKGDQLEMIKEELARTQQDRDMWRKILEEANRRQREEKARLKREHKKRSDCLKQLDLEKPERDVPRRNQPVELLTPREPSQTTEMQVTSGSGRLMTPNPSDDRGDHERAS